MFCKISFYVLVLRSIYYFLLERDDYIRYCQMAIEYSVYGVLLIFIVN